MSKFDSAINHAVGQRNTVSGIISPWMSISTEGLTRHELRIRAEPYTKERTTRSLMGRPMFPEIEWAEDFDAAVLSVADFGWVHGHESFYVLGQDNLLAWSERNADRLPAGHVIDLMPAHSAVYIREQYRNQPTGEVLHVAMKPIEDNVFTICNDGQGKRLGSYMREQGDMWGPDQLLVYRLRKKN